MKIIHLPTSTGGNAWGLAEGERALGLKSEVLYLRQNWLNYKYDICLHLEKRSKISNLLKRLETFLKIRTKYDVYHFNFGMTLIDFPEYNLNLIDLPYYKGKKIVTYNGCDARLKYETIKRTSFSPCHFSECYGGVCETINTDFLKRKRIEKVGKLVDHIFALNPDLMYILPENKTTFLPYTIAEWNAIKYNGFKIEKKIKIAHAPTNRVAKGSNYVLSALESLRKKYKNIEIILIENIPHSDAIKLYREAHIIIDQVLIGWYGGLGVEAMKMGIPLAVFIREEDLQFIPRDMAKQLKETIININPFNIEEELSKYIENPFLLYEKSKAALDYVNKWHDPLYVASITKKYYEE